MVRRIHEQDMTLARFAREFVAPREISGDLTRDAATRVLWAAATSVGLPLSWAEVRTFYAHEYEQAAAEHSAWVLLRAALEG